MFCRVCLGASVCVKSVSQRTWSTGRTWDPDRPLLLGRILGSACRAKSDNRSSGTDDVLQNWTKSILSSHSAEVENSEGLKRPPKATLKVQKDKGVGKYRRRMTDNTWTNIPMDDKIIWVDCEMTGLDPSVDKLIEIGIVITDKDLNVIAIQDSIVFHAEDAILDTMDPWCIEQHGKSGLTDAVKRSTNTHESVDKQLLEFLQKHTTKGECPMGGNSIGQDRGFIRRQLPNFHSHFHYRDIDVSSIKELVRRWMPEAYAAAPRKKRSHRVLDDILESIDELKYYRATVFASRSDAAAAAARVKRTV